MFSLTLHPFPIFLRDLPHRYTIQKILNALQAHTHLNVNVLLYSLWFALTEQGRLRRPEFKKLEAVLHPWHDRINVALEQLADSLDQARDLQQLVIAEAEAANQFEQQMLAQALPLIKKSRRTAVQQLIDASHNLATYYKVARIHVDETIHDHSLKILHLLFPDSNDSQITQYFDQALNAARLDEVGFTQLSLV